MPLVSQIFAFLQAPIESNDQQVRVYRNPNRETLQKKQCGGVFLGI